MNANPTAGHAPSRGTLRCGWLCGFIWLLAMAPAAVAAEWIPGHYETYTVACWIPVWVDGHWSWEWQDGHWETQTIDGHWEDQWVDGRMESVWVDGYWDGHWVDGYWEDNWVDGYWEDQWNDGHWEDQWVDGYWDEEGNWQDGYWGSIWIDGYWSWNWVDGHWESNWVDGHWDSNWVDGHWDDQWIDGYWNQVWIDARTEDVWVPGYYFWVWYDGYWTLEWRTWTETIWIDGHWEGPWTWTAFDEITRDWYDSSGWSPDPGTVPCGQSFTQSRTASRDHRSGERNEAGEERNVQTSTESGTFTQSATGTQWTHFDDAGPWAYSDWDPDAATIPAGQTFTQTRTGVRTRRTGERDCGGGEHNVVTTTETTTESQTAVGTRATGSPPTITSASTMAASAGQARTYLITATNNPSVYGLSWITGAPRYATFDPGLGTVTLAATQPGTYRFNVTATNGAGTSSSQTVTFTVNEFALSETPDFSLPGGVNPVGMLIPIVSWGLRNYGNNLDVASYPPVPGQAGFDVRVSSSWSKGNAGSQAIKVLILDTGVQSSPPHPALNRVAGTRNFTADRPDGDAGQPYSDNPALVLDSNYSLDTPANRALWERRVKADGEQHATKVASCVAGLVLKSGHPLDRASLGVAPGVSILSARVIYVSQVAFTSQIVGGQQRLVSIAPIYDLDHAKLIEALDWGEAQGARISNSSFRTGFVSSAVDTAYADTRGAAIAEVDVTSQYSGGAERGMVHFAATGNENAGEIDYPARIPVVNAVGAVHINAGRWVSPPDPANPTAPLFGSNYGSGIDFVAPGHQIMTAQPSWITRYPWDATVGDDYTNYWTIRGWYLAGGVPNERFANSGTSFASPHAAGVAALILSQNPAWTAAAVEARMQTTARPLGGTGYNTEFGWGIVDAGAATAPGVWNLVNLSTRAQVNTGEAYLGMGFVITGSENKRMLVRAVGPKLTAFGITGVLAHPSITLVRQSDGAAIATNTGWTNAPNLADVRATTGAVGAFPLDEGSADSALLVDLPPGAYTANVTGVGSTTGIALAEVYAATASRDTAKLINLSSRAYVGAGQSVMIPGLSINADSTRSVLIRAIGPSLPGVAGRIANPRITLWRLPGDAPAQVVKTNDDWGSEPNWPTVRGFAQAVGAFPIDVGSLDAAILMELPGGSYTVEVNGVGGASGVCLVEVYSANN